MKRLPPHRVAALAVLALGAYLQVVEWIDLHPWNDVRQGNGQESLDLILAGATLALAAALWMSRVWAPLVAAAGLTAWAVLQAMTWWAPYLLGASPGWRRVHARWFAETVQTPLPRDTLHLPPDANHLVLQILILSALYAALASVFAGVRRR